MEGPSPEDIKEMRRLQQLLNGMGEDDYASEPYAKKPVMNESYDNYQDYDPEMNRVAPPAVMVGDDADEIRRLIRAMDHIMPETINESRHNPELREAIITEKVNNTTVKVGAWQIEKKLMESAGKKDAFYEVSNVVTRQHLEPVLVYESAQAILKILNQGHNLNDKEIDAIMELDSEYQRLRSKALEEKAIWQRAKGSNLEWKQQLYESKFNSSQYQALYIKERIKNFLLK